MGVGSNKKNTNFDFMRLIAYDIVMQKYFDAHCHLNNADIPQNIAVINNATKISEWARTVELATAHPRIFGAIGVHPWYISDLPNDWDAQLRNLLIANPNIMVGEIGLDKYYPNMDIQSDIFSRQLEIAGELARGVHVHCVGAWDKLLHILKKHKSKLPPFILFHRYSGNPTDIARLANEYNAYFSYCDVRSKTIAYTPHDRILIETDSDNPANIIAIDEQMSKICNNCDFYENTIRMLKHG